MTVDKTGSPKGEESAKRLGEEFRAIREGAEAPIDQVEADLRIKGKYVIAMEEGDTAALPARVYTEGFIRNYAVYLGMDPLDAIRRFYAENGIKPETESKKAPKSATRAVRIDPLSGISEDRPRRKSGMLGRSMVALWPLLLVGGLGFAAYAGYDYVREIGIGGGSKSGPAISAQANAGTLSTPARRLERPASVRTVEGKPDVVGSEAVAANIRPASLSYARSESVPFWEAEPPKIDPADGPVADIDPETVNDRPRERRDGRWTVSAKAASQTPNDEDAARIAAEAREALIATLSLSVAESASAAPDAPSEPSEPASEGPQDGMLVVDMTAGEQASETVPAVTVEAFAPAPAMPASFDFAIHATADAWIQVEYASGRVAYTGTLSAGETYRIPNRTGLRLKTGNAGGLYIEVDGQRFGPLGSNGAIMRNVPLNPGAIRASYTLARQAQLQQ